MSPPVTNFVVNHDASTLSHELVVGTRDGSLSVWDVEQLRYQRHADNHDSPLTCLTMAPNGRRIATGSEDTTVRIWDTKEWTTVSCLQGHDEGVLCLGFSPDGRRIVSGSRDKTVRVWSLSKRSCLGVLRAHTAFVDEVAYSQDGKLIESIDDYLHRELWDSASLQRLSEKDGPPTEAFIYRDWMSRWTASRCAGTPGSRELTLDHGEDSSETVVKSARSGRVVGWFPVGIAHIVWLPKRRVFAALSHLGTHLYGVQVEGRFGRDFDESSFGCDGSVRRKRSRQPHGPTSKEGWGETKKLLKAYEQLCLPAEHSCEQVFYKLRAKLRQWRLNGEGHREHKQ